MGFTWDLWDETNSSPLKFDGCKTILSFWVSAYFQVLLLLVSRRVPSGKSRAWTPMYILFGGNCFSVRLTAWQFFVTLHCKTSMAFLGLPWPLIKSHTWTGTSGYRSFHHLTASSSISENRSFSSNSWSSRSPASLSMTGQPDLLLFTNPCSGCVMRHPALSHLIW